MPEVNAADESYSKLKIPVYICEILYILLALLILIYLVDNIAYSIAKAP
jgi:uncharacterized protein with PQ loop repeat